MNFIFFQHIPKKGNKLFLIPALCLLGFLLLVWPVQGQGPPGVPATYYGRVQAGSDFVPTASMAVTAYVDGNLCGESQTESHNSEIVYQINVMGAGPADNGCGTPSRSVTFFVESQEMAPIGLWDNGQLHEVDLHPVDTQVIVNSASSSTLESQSALPTNIPTPIASPTNAPMPSNTPINTATPTNTPTVATSALQTNLAASIDTLPWTPLALLAAIVLALTTVAGTLLLMRRQPR